MELNKNGRNFLLGTLLKSYLIQFAVCSVIIMAGIYGTDIAATWLFRRWYGEHYFLHYRALYTYTAGLVV